jgi:hypothetical protein
MKASNPEKRPRTVVYSAVFGGYDPVMPVVTATPDADFVLLTDVARRVPAPWIVRTVDVGVAGADPRMKNRWCKMHATELFPDHDLSMYVDGHLQLLGDLTPLLRDFTASGAPIGLMPHPKSFSAEHEVARSLQSGRISAEQQAAIWPEQRERHRAAGFQDDLGVFFAAFVLRDHSLQAAADIEAAWWEEWVRGVRRDQVALPFALWQTGTDPFRIPLDWTLEPYFRHWDHLSATQRYGRLVRWFECRRPLRPWYRWPVRILTLGPTMRAARSRLLTGGRAPSVS